MRYAESREDDSTDEQTMTCNDGRKVGDENEWRRVINRFDRVFHDWMDGRATHAALADAIEDYYSTISDTYLHNENTVRPVHAHNASSLAKEELLCRRRIIASERALKSLDDDVATLGDDPAVVRQSIYLKTLRDFGYPGSFEDPDYSCHSVASCHFRLR